MLQNQHPTVKKINVGNIKGSRISYPRLLLKAPKDCFSFGLSVDDNKNYVLPLSLRYDNPEHMDFKTNVEKLTKEIEEDLLSNKVIYLGNEKLKKPEFKAFYVKEGKDYFTMYLKLNTENVYVEGVKNVDILTLFLDSEQEEIPISELVSRKGLYTVVVKFDSVYVSNLGKASLKMVVYEADYKEQPKNSLVRPAHVRVLDDF